MKYILIFYSVFEGVFTEHPLLFTMVAVAQLVRAPDCGSGGRGFETHQPPIWLGEINGYCLFPNFACILNASKNIILKGITLFYYSYYLCRKVKQKKNLNIFPGRKPKHQYL